MPRITRNEFVTHLEGITAVLGALTYAGVDLPKWLPNGDDIKTVEQLAAVMNIPESCALVLALQHKGVFSDDLETKRAAIRFIRTAAGSARFHGPIGSPITEQGRRTMRGLARSAMAARHQGFTYNTQRGHQIHKGYAVSPYPQFSEAIPEHEFSISTIRDYQEKHADYLNKPHHYMGAWGDNGYIYLDVSVIVDDRQESIDIAKHSDQKATWNLETGEEILVDPNATSGGVLVKTLMPRISRKFFIQNDITDDELESIVEQLRYEARNTDLETHEKFLDIILENKALVRHVRDPEYWGLPYGAVIPPGYKPTGRHRRPSKPRSGTNKPDIGKDTDLHTYDPENPQTWWLSHHPWWNELSTLPDGTKVSIHTDKFETETRVRSAMTYTYEKKGDGVETYVRYTDEDDVDIRRGERPLASIGDLVNDALVMSNPNTSARPIVTIEYPDMPPVPIYGSHWGVDPDVLASNRDSFALKDNTMPSDMLNFETPMDLAVLPKGAAIEIEKHNGNTQYFVKVDDTNIDNPGQWEPFRGTDLNMMVDVPFSDREILHWIDETVDLGGSYSVADANSIYKESPKHERRRNEIRSVAGLDSLLPGSRIDLDVYDYDNGESFIRENDGTWWSVDNEEKVEPLYIVQKWAEVKERKGAVTHRIGRRNDLPNPLWRDVEIDYEYDEDGFNEDGYNQAGYDREGYDEDGYNEDDRDAEGYDRDGIDENGYDREGYDEDGYNMDGYNRDGESRDGEYDGQTNNGLGAKGKPYVKLATRDMDYNWQDRTPEIELAEQLPTMQEIWDKIVAGDNYGTDIKAVYEMQMESGLRSEVTFSRYDSYDNAVTIEGTIRTPDNQRAGTFTRKIYTHTNGSLTAENYYLKIDTPYQGHGFASEFNRRLENWYIANGFDSVQVHADIDKGGYSWARDGFDWRESSAVQARSILGRIRQKAEDLGDIDTMEQTEDLREQLSRSEYVSESDIPTPFELSNLGWEPGKTTWAGREGMLDSNWYGVKYLNPNSRALNVLQEMVRQGKAESKVKKKKDKGVFIAKEGVRYIPPIPQSDLTIPGIELFERAQVRAPDTTMISAPFGGNHNPYVFRTQDGYSFLLWVDKEGVRTRPIQFREDDPSIPDKRPFVSYDSADDALKAIQDGYDQRRQVAKNKREANRLKRLREQEEIRTGLAHNRTVASVRPISREGLSPDALALVEMVDQYAPDATVVEVDTPNNPSGALYRVRMKDGFSYYLDVPSSPALVLPAPAFVPGDPNGTNSIQRFDDTQAALQYIQSEYAKRKKAGQAYLESLNSDIEELLRSINS